MQNKANFRNDKMNITIDMTSNYMIESAGSGQKTNPIQTQSKPKQTQFKPNKAKNKPNYLSLKGQRPCRACLNTLFRRFLEGFSYGTIKRHSHPNIKAPADKRQPKLFTRPGSSLHAKTTVYTLTGLINSMLTHYKLDQGKHYREAV
jgi:hypothetical protein